MHSVDDTECFGQAGDRIGLKDALAASETLKQYRIFWKGRKIPKQEDILRKLGDKVFLPEVKIS